MFSLTTEMEPLRFRDGDHYFEEHSGRLAPGTKKTRRGTSSQPEREIIATLKSATGETHRVDVEALIHEARAARAKFARQISDAEINAWKRAGRP